MLFYVWSSQRVSLPKDRCILTTATLTALLYFSVVATTARQKVESPGTCLLCTEQFCFPFLSVQGQVVYRLQIWWSFVFVLSTVTHATSLILLYETGPRCCDGGQPTSQALQTQRRQSLSFSFRDLSLES